MILHSHRTQNMILRYYPNVLLYFGDIPNLVSCAFSTIPIFPPFIYLRPAPGCAHVRAHAHSANPAAPARPTCAEIERASRCRSALGRGGGTVGRLSVLSRQNRYGWQLCEVLLVRKTGHGTDNKEPRRRGHAF